TTGTPVYRRSVLDQPDPARRVRSGGEPGRNHPNNSRTIPRKGVCCAMNVSLSSKATPVAATWKDYLALTKPRIISLLLFTTLAAMFIADAHKVTFGLFLAVLFGGYAAAGAANAFNMIYDRDIDRRMDRTAQRPTVTQVISTRNAFLFALSLAV